MGFGGNVITFTIAIFDKVAVATTIKSAKVQLNVIIPFSLLFIVIVKLE
jgi:hypothetical protein